MRTLIRGRALALALLLLAVGLAGAHVPDPPPLDPPPGEPAPPAPAGALPRTYGEAHALAVQAGKPLIVWTGAAICMPCAKANAGEFISFVTSTHPLFPPDTLTVGVPHRGGMVMAGQVREWPSGHIPAVREVLRRWRESGRTVLSLGTRGEPGSAWPQPLPARQAGTGLPMPPVIPAVRADHAHGV